MTKIDITGRDKAEVLLRLYNGGFMDAALEPAAAALQRHLPPLTLERAREIVAGNPSIGVEW